MPILYLFLLIFNIYFSDLIDVFNDNLLFN